MSDTQSRGGDGACRQTERRIGKRERGRRDFFELAWTETGAAVVAGERGVGAETNAPAVILDTGARPQAQSQSQSQSHSDRSRVQGCRLHVITARRKHVLARKAARPWRGNSLWRCVYESLAAACLRAPSIAIVCSCVCGQGHAIGTKGEQGASVDTERGVCEHASGRHTICVSPRPNDLQSRIRFRLYTRRSCRSRRLGQPGFK